MAHLVKSKTRTIAVAALAAMTMATGLIGAAPAAQARDGRNAALFGGLAAGAIIGGAIAQGSRAPAYGYGYGDSYGSRGYGYAAPRAYYAAPSYEPAEGYYAPQAYVQECYRERRAVYDRWGGFAGYRTVRVCD